jgi:PTH1 family peptidyl-tRNA hydrolase
VQLRRRRPAASDEADGGGPWIVLGLGNPDDEGYANTRHNAGAMVVTRLAERAGAPLRRSRNRARVAEIRDGGARVVLARPNGYVNESGGPASLLARWYRTPVGRIIVVHDEIDLAYGKLQLRRDGGTAGHNGLKDVAKALGSPDFLRVRIGVGRPPGRKDPADYVLEPIARRDAEDFAVLIERAADAAMDLVHLPLERAQDRHNG